MDNSSLKKELIYGYTLLPQIEGLKTNVVTVITPAGIITGTPLSPEETDASIKLIDNINSSIADRYRKDSNLEAEQSLPGNDGFFTLKDAKLLSGSATNSFNVINIFYDQVVAITIGSISN